MPNDLMRNDHEFPVTDAHHFLKDVDIIFEETAHPGPYSHGRPNGWFDTLTGRSTDGMLDIVLRRNRGREHTYTIEILPVGERENNVVLVAAPNGLFLVDEDGQQPGQTAEAAKLEPGMVAWVHEAVAPVEYEAQVTTTRPDGPFQTGQWGLAA
jgi:hypothetical protein